MEWDTRLKKPQLLEGGGGTVPGILLVLDDQDGAVINWNKKEISPTIRAQDHGHPPIVVIEDESYRIRYLQPDCDRRCIKNIELDKK